MSAPPGRSATAPGGGSLLRMAHVLVVDDEPHIGELVSLHLSFEGHTSDRFLDGRAALDASRTQTYDLFIIDVMLPGIDGVALCRALRQQPSTRRAPVLLLTARRDETDKVLGLDSGADDYLTKPFGVRELMARVRALLRRAPGAGACGCRGRPAPMSCAVTASKSTPRGTR